jgi:hypothetical protein
MSMTRDCVNYASSTGLDGFMEWLRERYPSVKMNRAQVERSMISLLHIMETGGAAYTAVPRPVASDPEKEKENDSIEH